MTSSPSSFARWHATRSLLASGVVGVSLVLGAVACGGSPAIVAVPSSEPAGSSTTAAPASTRAPGTTTDGTDDSVDDRADAEFVEAADAICTTSREELAEVEAPQTEEDVPAYLQTQLGLMEDQFERLSKLDPPADTKLWERTLDDLGQYNDRVRELIEKEATVDEINTDSELQSLREQGQNAAEELGLQVCGSGGTASESTTTTRAPRQSTTTTAEEGRGDPIPDDPTGFTAEDCDAIASAALDLTLAITTDDAVAAADALYAYTPPTEVKFAVEVLVDGPGLQDSDGPTSQASDTVTAWVSAVCP